MEPVPRLDCLAHRLLGFGPSLWRPAERVGQRAGMHQFYHLLQLPIYSPAPSNEAAA
jgi:hypothetical protein